jgi:Protein of unknown function (DUF3341)
MTAWLLAEFAESKRIIDAARRAGAAELRPVDAFTPFPVEGLNEFLHVRADRIRPVMFIAGMAAAVLVYGLEYYSAVINYPYNSGGRPLDAWPAFMLVPFAVGILAAAIAGFIAFLLACRLPRLHHSLFAVDQFEHASQDRFFLAVERPGDDQIGPAMAFLRNAGATTIRELKIEDGS